MYEGADFWQQQQQDQQQQQEFEKEYNEYLDALTRSDTQ
jgi:hypothetical protein